MGSSASSLRRQALARRRVQTQAFLNFARIERAIERRVTELMTAHRLEDVTSQQANLLMILFEERAPLTGRTLAERMELAPQTVGRFIKALLAKNWVERHEDPEDRRALLVRPTRKAYRALPRFIAVSNALLDQALADFDDAALRRLDTAAQRVLDNLSPTRSSE